MERKAFAAGPEERLLLSSSMSVDRREDIHPSKLYSWTKNVIHHLYRRLCVLGFQAHQENPINARRPPLRLEANINVIIDT